MKNHFLGISIANNTLLEEASIDDALNLCVSILCESQEMERCYIYNGELKKISYSHINLNRNVKDKFDKKEQENILDNLFSKIDEFPADAKMIMHTTTETEHILFKQLMNSRNLESFHLFPIISNKKYWGFMAFENHEKINLIDEEVRALSLLAKNIGIRLYKDSLVDSLGAQLENLNYYMNGTNQAMWELDLNTFIPTYSYHWAEMIGYDMSEIKQTYLFWQENVHPEDLLDVEKSYIII